MRLRDRRYIISSENEKEVVISYNSKSLNDRQRNYCISEKECKAIIWAVEILRHYLHGTHFTIRTDNCSLCYINKIRKPNGRLIRWSISLQEYDYTVEFKSGKKHTNVDCLSRYPTELSGIETEEFPILLTETVDIGSEQNKDD